MIVNLLPNYLKTRVRLQVSKSQISQSMTHRQPKAKGVYFSRHPDPQGSSYLRSETSLLKLLDGVIRYAQSTHSVEVDQQLGRSDIERQGREKERKKERRKGERRGRVTPLTNLNDV